MRNNTKPNASDSPLRSKLQLVRHTRALTYDTRGITRHGINRAVANYQQIQRLVAMGKRRQYPVNAMVSQHSFSRSQVTGKKTARHRLQFTLAFTAFWRHRQHQTRLSEADTVHGLPARQVAATPGLSCEKQPLKNKLALHATIHGCHISTV